MMTGVLLPDEGEITLNGKNIVTQPVEAKREFGLVPDTPDLFLRLTGMEYIQFMADIYHIDTQTRNQRIKKWLVMLDNWETFFLIVMVSIIDFVPKTPIWLRREYVKEFQMH